LRDVTLRVWPLFVYEVLQSKFDQLTYLYPIYARW